MMRAVAVTRLIAADDASALADLLVANRAFLAPSSPKRPPAYHTVAGQREAIAEALTRYEVGTAEPRVIVCHGAVVGRVTLSDITREPLQSCHLGYWVSESHNGRGLATAAVGEIMRVAFGELGLHRIEAGTLPHNVRSQAVLARNGFARFGVAPAYLRIAGEWQDHVLFQALAPPAAPDATDGGAAAVTRLACPTAAATVDAFYAVQRRFYAGEPVEAEMAAFLVPEIAWHVPGASAIAGHYRGQHEVLAYFRRRRDLAGRSFVITPRGTLADETRVAHFADGEAVLGGETHRWRTVGIFEVAGERIAECWLVPFDQFAFDAIWAAR
jgi:ribosomal-protein-alanine N-acetyltransferase